MIDIRESEVRDSIGSIIELYENMCMQILYNLYLDVPRIKRFR